IDDLAGVSGERKLSAEEVEEIAKVGDNTGCMALKGGTRSFQGEQQADQWQAGEYLEAIAKRWGIEPDRDLYYAGDPRDLRDRGMPKHGLPQLTDKRLYVQLQVYTGAGAEETGAAIEAIRATGLDAVVYADANDPRGIAVLTLTEDPEVMAGKARVLLGGEPFAKLKHRPELTMVGRTYGFGRETDVDYFLTKRPVEYATNDKWKWAIWYPLRRKGAFYALPKAEQAEVLKEHGMIGFQFGSAGYAGDIRLASFGLDRDDNEFVLGIMGPRLDWLSKLVEKMRPTVQTSTYMDKLGPFFVGRVLWQSGQDD
ncbi:MAG: chlorite dismutase family protein, partial [Verrucomicrobiales bacterium]|nr:chlorite dismutase family protein [Verrucomicrobiales bacterium]